MKVYIKSKFNPIVNQLIPHNINFANAMYGFLEMGADVELFKDWQDIKDKLTKDDILVDYIDRVVQFVEKFGGKFDFPDYPDEFKAFYKRKIWKDNIKSFASNPKKFEAGYFIKPVKEKAFTGIVVKSPKDLIGCADADEIYVSEPLDIVKEWRVFILYDKVVGIKPYKGELESKHTNNIYYFSQGYLLDVFKSIKNRPNACSIDIGIVEKNDMSYPVVIECNDMISLGSYGLNSIEYAKMISARQSQVLNRKDEFTF